MKEIGPLLVVGLCAGFALPVQAWAADVEAICARVADAEPPVSDEPTLAQRTALANCDGEAMLYGIGRPADPVDARLCAFVERADPANAGHPSGLFDGNGLLMTIYASGMGVARRPDVATHLACADVASAPAEREGRVGHLSGTVHETWYKPVFSPCDDVTSGYQEGVCAAHDSRVAGVARTARVDAFAAGLTPAARVRFAALRTAQAKWAQARADGEIDQSGTDRGAVTIAEADLQTTDFTQMLERLRTRPPHTGAVALHAAQARIDAALASLLTRKPGDVPGEVTPAGIRSAQAAWLAYRDAWGAFAAVAYPGWGSEGAEAWVSIKRADMLTRMASAPD